MATEEAGISGLVETTTQSNHEQGMIFHLPTTRRESSTKVPDGSVPTSQEKVEFNASETYKRLKQKIREKVGEYRDQLSKLSRNDFMLLTQNMRNHPDIGLPTELILEVFTEWASVTAMEGDTKKAVLAIARGISDSIKAMPDSDYFGDMSDTENKHNALYTLSLRDGNKTADLTLLVRQSSIRANRIKKELNPVA